MKYVKTIFENENIQELVTNNEELIDLATESLLKYNLELEATIYENLEDYIVDGDITATYESIRNVVIDENVSIINEISHVLGSDIPIEDKVEYFQEGKRNYRYTLSKDIKNNVADAVSQVGKSAKNIHKSITKKTNPFFARIGSIGTETGKVGTRKLVLDKVGNPLSRKKLITLGKKRAAYAAGGLAAAGAAGTAGAIAAKNAQDEDDLKKKVALGVGGAAALGAGGYGVKKLLSKDKNSK